MEEEKNPLLVIAYGLAIGLVLAGFGFGLKWIIPAIGAAIGIATTLISGGVLALTSNPWVVPAASAGLAIGGCAIGIVMLARITKEAKKNPYEWTLPILAIVSGIVIDGCKELFTEDNKIRVLYAGAIAALYLIAGILWRQKKIKVKYFALKIISILLFLLPPFWIYYRQVQNTRRSFLETWKGIPENIKWSIVALLFIMIITTILSWVFKEDEDSPL